MSFKFTATTSILHHSSDKAALSQHKRCESRAIRHARHKAERGFLSEHRKIQSADSPQDEEAPLSSFFLDAPCVAAETPRVRIPVHDPLPVYEGHFSEASECFPQVSFPPHSHTTQCIEQDVSPMDDLVCFSFHILSSQFNVASVRIYLHSVTI